MVNETKIQWHPAFCSAMELTFLKDAGALDYTSEFNLPAKPLQADFLVIKKNKDTQIRDEIGRIFRRYNLLEYKSPGDGLNIDTWYKTIAYGCLYKILAGKRVDQIPADEITLTIVRRERPKKLLDRLAADGSEICCPYPGIYHVNGNTLFETQIIATKELPPETHIWLKALTRNIDEEEARQVVDGANRFPDASREHRLADSVLQVAVSANHRMFEHLKKEDPIMCDALRELMKPELDEALENKEKETAQKIAMEMICNGEPDAKITLYTKLTKKQVTELRKEKENLVTA